MADRLTPEMSISQRGFSELIPFRGNIINSRKNQFRLFFSDHLESIPFQIPDLAGFLGLPDSYDRLGSVTLPATRSDKGWEAAKGYVRSHD